MIQNNKSGMINRKFMISHGLILLAIIIISSMVFFITNSQKFDSLRINLAGRQRMLSQRISKELLLYNQDLIEADKVRSTILVFEQTLKALTYGGEAPLNVNMTAYITLPQMEVKTTYEQLRKGEVLWKDFNSQAELVLNTKDPEALEAVIANNITLLKAMDAAVVMMQVSSEKKTTSIFIVIITGLVLSAGIFIFSNKMTRAITTPILKIVETIGLYSEGNLSLKIDEEHLQRNDEIGILARSLQEMIVTLAEIVEMVLTSSDQIASASTQLASGNNDLSSRTEQQAAALEETSAAIEEINSTIRSNADNTEIANTVSLQALEKTEVGSRSVSKMITSMEEISVASSKIADIIEVINNIAFQTNLLALNASIEAARAGEQGKGFAVVAVEVRKLAKRSDKAAAEVAQIIEDSKEKVEKGVGVAHSTGDVLNEIESSVKKVNALIAEVTAASKEQLLNVDEMEKSMNSLDNNTQRNATLVEEAAAATEELSAQAMELRNNMDFFQLDERDEEYAEEQDELSD